MSCGSSECLFQTFHFNSWYLLKCLFQQYINGGRKMGIHRAAQHCDVVENQCVNMSLWFPVMRILDHVMWTFKIIGLKISWQCFNKRPVWTKYKYMLSLSPPLNHSALLYQQVALLQDTITCLAPVHHESLDITFNIDLKSSDSF